MLLYLAVALVVACTPARRELPQNNITRNIAFEGNGGSFSGHNDYQLRQQLESDYTRFGLLTWPFLYFVEPKVFKQELLPRDAYRLETWYAHNGWFDAQILGWEVRRIRDIGERRAGVVDIFGFVKPGTPSLVRSLEIKGLDGSLKILGGAATRDSGLKVGDQYSLEYAETLRQNLLDTLRDHTHAYADVDVSSTAYPAEHEVDVGIEATPGIVSRYGRVTVTGNNKVPTHIIESAIPFEMGQPYKHHQLSEAQQRLFGMSTFSIVNVEPDLRDPTQELVPINVRVTESKFRTFRMGIGGDIDSNKVPAAVSGAVSANDGVLIGPGGFTPRVKLGFSHVNLFNQLIRFDTEATGGFDYALVNAEDQLQLTYGLKASFSYPRIAGQRVTAELHGQMIQDVQSSLWGYRRQEADIQLVWNAYNSLQFRAGPHVEQYVYLFEGEAQNVAARRLFGSTYANLPFVAPLIKPLFAGDKDVLHKTYKLTALDEFVIWDLRDDKFDTTRGSYYSAHAREAIPVLHDGPYYVSLALDGRWYRPVRVSRKDRDFPFIIALGARGEVLQAFKPKGHTDADGPLSDLIPYPELAFMGGANSIRGFRQDQVGPYDTLCSYDARPNRQRSLASEALRLDPGRERPPEDHFFVPHGGTMAAQTSAELRYRWSSNITFATFTDVGMLAANIRDLGLDRLRVSAGVGGRYSSPIGPLRLDLSFRPLYEEDMGGPDTSICNSPGHSHTRVYDSVSSFSDTNNERGNDVYSRDIPFAMVFFIAIGESI